MGLYLAALVCSVDDASNGKAFSLEDDCLLFDLSESVFGLLFGLIGRWSRGGEFMGASLLFDITCKALPEGLCYVKMVRGFSLEDA